MPRLRILIAVTSMLACFASAEAGTTSVTTCHQAVIGGVAELANDLDCSAVPLAIGVELHHATLRMNGHTITGAAIGVTCDRRCKIVGPGTITGNSSGVEQYSDKPGVVKATGVTLSGNDSFGIAADKIMVVASTLDGNGGLVMNGNPIGAGIRASLRVTVTDSTVTGNLSHGVCSPAKIRLARSTVQANGTAPGCQPVPGCGCGDLISNTKPSVSQNSACDTSIDPSAGTWGICSGD